MVDLTGIKESLLRTVLEESEKFRKLPEAEQQAQISRMVKLTPERQKELCKFFVREEKDKLPARLLVRFFQKINNSMTALTTVAAKDKAILNKYRKGRSIASETVI